MDTQEREIATQMVVFNLHQQLKEQGHVQDGVVDYSSVSSRNVRALTRMLASQRISKKTSKFILKTFMHEEDLEEVVQEHQLEMVSDIPVIHSWCLQVVANPAYQAMLAKYLKDPKDSYKYFFVGKALQDSELELSPVVLKEVMGEVLEGRLEEVV